MLLPVSWTWNRRETNAVSEFREVMINGAAHTLLIRGADRRNPVIVFVHGGPGCSEIPYVVKYQKKLERYFTIIHYDQRGSGKSFHKGVDYGDLTVSVLTADLREIIDYACREFKKEKIILAGHSFGTEIGLRTAAEFPEKILAYVGIGQMSYTAEGEMDSLAFCLEGAKRKHRKKDCEALLALAPEIEAGRTSVPRSYVRRYGGAARGMNDNADYLTGLLFRPEYSVLDAVKLIRGLSASRNLYGTTAHELAVDVREVRVPCYFLQGKYDYMTSTNIARKYFVELKAPEKEFVLFEKSAHFPQFEENEKYTDWMREKFGTVK